MAHSRYYHLTRPPHYGHQPDGWTAQAGGGKMDFWTTSDGTKIEAHGWSAYAQPLDMDVIWKWSLYPDDPLERAHYHFYLMADRDADNARYYEEDYMQYRRENPDDFAKHHDAEVCKFVDLLIVEADLAAQLKSQQEQ